MRRVVFVSLLAAALVAGCRSSTDLGLCVGLDGADRNPALEYRLSTRNVVLAVVFVETVIVPIVVALNETYCPVAKKSDDRAPFAVPRRGGGQ